VVPVFGPGGPGGGPYGPPGGGFSGGGGGYRGTSNAKVLVGTMTGFETAQILACAS